jgi:hypothetical protein
MGRNVDGHVKADKLACAHGVDDDLPVAALRDGGE